MRLALAAIVFCSTLCGALDQMPTGSPAEREPSRAAITADAPLGCTPADDGGGWRPQHVATASITESVWKWRTLHAVVAATPRPEAILANALSDPPPARAPDAPSYLLHTPLLI